MSAGGSHLVTDPSGGTGANGKIMLRNDATGENQTSTSGTNGEFHFPLLRPGSYTLSITAAGFQRTEFDETIAALFDRDGPLGIVPQGEARNAERGRCG